jgi:hypothetical protein
MIAKSVNNVLGRTLLPFSDEPTWCPLGSCRRGERTETADGGRALGPGQCEPRAGGHRHGAARADWHDAYWPW